MDEERFFAEDKFYFRGWDAGLQVEDGVGVEGEGVEDAVDFGILGWKCK